MLSFYLQKLVNYIVVQMLGSAMPPLKGARQTIGYLGETAAVRYLKKQHFTIVKRNWKTLRGELDIIAMENNELVFVEVKTRLDSVTARLRLLDTITAKKQRKLKFLAEHFMRRHFAHRLAPNYRIDAIGIILAADQKRILQLKHLRRIV